MFLIISSCSSRLEYTISLSTENCLIYEDLDHSIINDSLDMILVKPQLEILINSTENKKEKIITIKNLTDNVIIMNSAAIDYPDIFSNNYLKCRKEKGYNLLIKKYLSEYVLFVSIDNNKKLFPKEQLKVNIEFDNPGTYKIQTQFYNKQKSEENTWRLGGIIIQESELFTVN